MMSLSQTGYMLEARQSGGDVRFTSVSTDSRNIKPGGLFIALRGAHFDGYDYVATAMRSGAVAAMVNADSIEARASTLDPAIPLLIVKNTRLALGQLAAYWRRQFDIPLVAITGSNGKTTVKEMLAEILRMATQSDQAVLATQGNYNNDIGMPLTLLQLNGRHRYAVIEMGMNHSGEINYLAHIARPDIALITNASGAHLEGLGSVEAVAYAKGEIFAGLGPGGAAVINADDDHAPLWRVLAGTHERIEFNLDGMARRMHAPDAEMPPGQQFQQPTGFAVAHGCEAGRLAVVAGQWYQKGSGLHLDVQTTPGNFGVDLRVPGAHNARNALAAISAAIILKIPLKTIATGLEKFGGVAGRLQYKSARHGALVIDDTYNANPASMRAAIGVLAQAGGRRVLVMGDMGELGEDAAELHAGIGTAACNAGIERLLALGALSIRAVRAFGCGAEHFECIEDLYRALEDELDVDVTVLVKGSRFMKMERVVRFCTDGKLDREEGKPVAGNTEKGVCISPPPSCFTPSSSRNGGIH